MKNNNTIALNALQRLKNGNKAYIDSVRGAGDISPEIRSTTAQNGQKPYAIIVSCSDSRVIPEYIFSAGIGELFVIRVAGNVIDSHQLGSIEYAIQHLDCKLVVVLGHTCCGAINAAVNHNSGYVKYVADEIKLAIGNESDATRASILNIGHSVTQIKNCLNPPADILVTGALYHTHSGVVDFDIFK